MRDVVFENRRDKLTSADLLTALFYTLLALIFTAPLGWRLKESYPGLGGDVYQFLWFVWRDGLALFGGGEPLFQSGLVFHPVGAHLNAEPLPLGLLFGLLSQLISIPVAYNILYLFLFVFAAWGAYRLALYLLNDRPSAILAGVIYGFSPYMMIKGLGHLNMMSNGFLALGILELLKSLDDLHTFNRHAIFSGVLLGLAGLSSSYLTVYIALWLTGFFLYLWISKGLRAKFSRLAVTITAMGLLLLPQILPMLIAATKGYYSHVNVLGSAYLASNDLLGFLAPSGLNTFWGKLARSWFGGIGSGAIERTIGIGLVALVLLISGWKAALGERWGRWTVAWTFGAWIMSLGPFLQVAGRMTYIPLPGLVLNYLPLVNNARSMGRWSMVTTLGVALIAAAGWKKLSKHPRIVGRQKLVFSGAVALICLEFLPVPYPTVTAMAPEFLKSLPFDPAHQAILDLPIGRKDGLGGIGEFDARQLLFQTIHKRPLVGGYVLRMSDAARAEFGDGLYANLLTIQARTLPKPQLSVRGSSIRDKVVEICRSSPISARFISFIIGSEKVKKLQASVSDPFDLATLLVKLDPVEVLRHLDADKIGLIIAASPERPFVKAELDYLLDTLPLEFVAGDSACVVYRIKYE